MTTTEPEPERLPITYLWLPGPQLMLTHDLPSGRMSFQQPWGLHELDPNPKPEPEPQVALIPFPMPSMEEERPTPGRYL